MSRDFKCKATGKEICLNVFHSDWYCKITAGLWDKIGGNPKTHEDALLVARILENHAIYSDYENPKYFYRHYKLMYLSPEKRKWLREEVIPFFKNATKGVCDPNVNENC